MYSNQERNYGRVRHSHHSQSSKPHCNGNNNSEWSCTECTFLNAGSKTRCDMCLTAKPLHITEQSNGNNNGNNNANNNIPPINKKKSGVGGIKFDVSLYDQSSPSTHKNGKHQNGYGKQSIGRKPNHSIFPANVTFNPKKSISKQTIFERWMIAQIERTSGQQPTILVQNGIMLTNLRRVRAPTTYETIQQQIDANTQINNYSKNNLEAGDWTDDEEDELHTPRSPTPSDIEDNLFINESKEDVNDYTYNMKKSLDKRRRKKTRNKSKKKETVISLWYKSQLELKQGRNPFILNKYNITLTNIRQHNPRFKDYQRRKSQHEKAATYLQVTGDKLHTNVRNNIANDDDEQYDDVFSDTENDSQPNTPLSHTNTYSNQNNCNQQYGNSNQNNNFNIFNPYDPNQYGE